jgi:TonB family protein
LFFGEAHGTIDRMMSRMLNPPWGAILVALLSSGSAAAAAREPLRLAPSSKWLVNYAEDSCRMARSFGKGEQRVMLIADRYEPGDMLQISFYGQPARAKEDSEVPVRFGPAEAAQTIGFYPGTLGDKTPGITLQTGIRIAPLTMEQEKAQERASRAGDFAYAVPDIGPAREEAVTFIEVLRPVHTPFILETGSLGPPLAALRKCTDELLGHWGIDVSRHASLTRRAIPKTDPSHWMRSRDYPSDMLARGNRAIVQFRLNIDTKGEPTECHIQQSTRPQAFDDAVCKAIMRNARFEPALDAGGSPIASYWVNAVRFHI